MAIDFKKIESIQDAVVTVMGLGRFKQGSGIGAAKWLLRHGAQIVITDLKSEAELRESVEDVMGWYTKYRQEFPDRDIYQPVFVLGEHHEDDFIQADLVLQNPGVPRESAFVQLAREHGVPIESDVSLFFRWCPFPIYAVTGTRGKSTTTALLGEMLKTVNPKTVIAGNIAHSPLEDLDWLLTEKNPVPIVLELSSWLLESLENVARGPDIGILTNAFKDHLDRYASYESYLAAKELMFKLQKPDQIAIINVDNEIVRDIGNRVGSRRYWFSEQPFADKEGSFIDSDTLVLAIEGKHEALCKVSEMALQGRHNVQNALAASLAAHFAHVPHDKIAATLKTFVGLPGRQETVREWHGVTFVNDTTATSPEGAMAALDRFGKAGKVVLIAGGSSKGFTFEEMGAHARTSCKYAVLLEGTATDDVQKAIGDSVPSVRVKSMKKAVEAAANVAVAGDIVLLSPGTASFGLFKNEFDRGGQFVEAVKNLKE